MTFEGYIDGGWYAAAPEPAQWDGLWSTPRGIAGRVSLSRAPPLALGLVGLTRGTAPGGWRNPSGWVTLSAEKGSSRG